MKHLGPKLLIVSTALFILGLVLLAVGCGKEEKATPTAKAAAGAPAATTAATAAPAATTAATAAPTATKAATAAPTTAPGGVNWKLAAKLEPDLYRADTNQQKTSWRGEASAAAMTPSRKIAEQILKSQWYTTMPIRPNEKPRMGGFSRITYYVQGHWSAMTPGGMVARNVPFNKLVHFPDNRISSAWWPNRDPLDGWWTEPDLAKSWEISGDGLTYTFKLVDNAQFHDIPPVNGRKLTSADVKFTLDKYRTEAPGRSNLEFVQDIQTPDALTVVIKLSQPFPGLLMFLSTDAVSIFAKECYEEKGCLENKPIGTGAFVLAEYNKAQNVLFKRNPNYFKKDRWGQQLPYLDKVEIVQIPDRSTEAAAFRTGQIDCSYQAVSGLKDYEALKKSNPDTVFQSFPGPVGGDVEITFQLNKKPFDDVRVRQAISMAIDRELMYMTVVDGFALSSVLMPPIFLGLDIPPAWGDWPWKGKDTLQYNPTKAKQLLAEAGYPNGFKTQFVNSATSLTPTCLHLMCLPAHEFLQAQLKAIGIDAEIKSVPAVEWTTKYSARDWEGMYVRWNVTGGGPDSYLRGTLNSKSSVNKVGPLPGQDPTLDDLTEKQAHSLNTEEMIKLWNQIIDRVYEQQYVVSVGKVIQAAPFQPWMENMATNPVAWRCGSGPRGVEEDWMNDKAPKR